MRTAILVSTPIDTELWSKVKMGLCPKPDFLALAEPLGANLITPFQRQSFGRFSKHLRYLQLAWAAFHMRHDYDLIISDVDRAGLLLALLFKLSRVPNQHVMICHGKVVQPWDLRLIRKFQLQSYIHRFVCYGEVVARKLRDSLSLPSEQVVTIRHAVDHHFWKPLQVPSERLIVSAGLLRRDYPTIIEAVRGLDVSLIIAPYSPWVTETFRLPDSLKLPSNVHIARCTYYELRGLYARAMAIAIPLTESYAQSGSLVTYEAMAMGKAVLVTRTRGQAGMGLVGEGETGYYIAPGDVDGWRNAIKELSSNRDKATEMGRRSRETVERGLNLHTYVKDMSNIVHSVYAERGHLQMQVPGYEDE